MASMAFLFKHLSCSLSRLQCGGMAAAGTRTMAAAATGEKSSYGGLKDQDRIFTNLYGKHEKTLKVRKGGWEGEGDWKTHSSSFSLEMCEFGGERVKRRASRGYICSGVVERGGCGV